jgi:hypothetical protein
MGKKTLLIALAVMLTMFSLASCAGKTTGSGDTDTSADVTATETTAAPDTTVEETTAEETTAAPRDTFEYVDFFVEKDDGGHDPHSISDVAGTALGAKFTAAGYWTDISLTCPSWSDNVGTMTFAVYKWNTDYNTTIAAQPVYTTDFVDYTDNEVLTVEFDGDGLPADTYLWLIKDGTGGVGIWGKNVSDDPNIVTYLNGEVVTTFGPEASATVRIPAAQ